MNINKLLYATDLTKQALTYTLIKKIQFFQQLGMDEIVFLQTTLFDDWTRGLSDIGVKSKVLMEKKLSSSSILRTAREARVSLIVINLDMNVKKKYHNSIIKGLIKQTSLPILFVNSNGKITVSDDKDLLTNIVFATDWSPVSENAFKYLLALKKNIGQLDIINVINKKLTVKDMRKLRERLAKTRKICLGEGIDAEAHIYAGKTAEEVLLASKDYRATIIFMGGRTKNKNILDLFTGSTPYRIAVEAFTPVLIIP